MPEELPSACPEPLRLAFLDVLTTTLLHIRNGANDVRFAVALADHAHNIPALLSRFHPDLLRFSWEVERQCLVRALAKSTESRPGRSKSLGR